MMEPEIQNITAVFQPPSTPGGARTIARFTVDVDGIRIFGLLLREHADGTFRTVSPNLAGQHVMTFRRDIAEKITTAASAALLQGGRLATNTKLRSA
jgi:hypothetical protein